MRYSFQYIPEIQEQSQTILDVVSKKTSSSSGRNAGCIALTQKGTTRTNNKSDHG